MNRIILPVALVFFTACSNQPGSENKKDETLNKKEQHVSDLLQLNNGKKWKLDQSTTKNIAAIKSSLSDAADKDFQKLAISLQQKTNQLVAECRMEGPDHEALHLWLEQWLTHLRYFKENGKDQQQGYKSLQKDLKEFDQYFE